MGDFSEIDAVFEGDVPKRRGRPPGSTNTKSKADVSAKQEDEAKAGWCSFFELLCIPLNSEAQFDEKEFIPMARSTVRLIDTYPQLRILLILLAVVCVPGQGAKFLKRVLVKRVKEESQQVQEPTPIWSQPVNG